MVDNINNNRNYSGDNINGCIGDNLNLSEFNNQCNQFKVASNVKNRSNKINDWRSNIDNDKMSENDDSGIDTQIMDKNNRKGESGREKKNNGVKNGSRFNIKSIDLKNKIDLSKD